MPNDLRKDHGWASRKTDSAPNFLVDLAEVLFITKVVQGEGIPRRLLSIYRLQCSTLSIRIIDNKCSGQQTAMASASRWTRSPLWEMTLEGSP